MVTAPTGVIDRSPQSDDNLDADGSSGGAGVKLQSRRFFSARPLGALAVLLLTGLLSIHMMMTANVGIPAPEPSETNLMPDAPPDQYWCILWGYTYDADGVTPLPDCLIEITNVNTSESITTVAGGGGFYAADLAALPSGWEYGDIINLTATKDVRVGWNETPITNDAGLVPPMIWINVTLNAETAIPEFSSAASVLGITCVTIAVFAILRDRTEKRR